MTDKDVTADNNNLALQEEYLEELRGYRRGRTDRGNNN